MRRNQNVAHDIDTNFLDADTLKREVGLRSGCRTSGTVLQAFLHHHRTLPVRSERNQEVLSPENIHDFHYS